MSKLVWDKSGEHIYETGVSQGVLYLQDSDGSYPQGVAWNGLTSVSESPEGGDANELWADNIKYLSLRSAEQFKATIEAYTYPDEFAECDGSAYLAEGIAIGQQSRKAFGFCYKTQVGNDIDGSDHGYKIHIVYGGTVSPSEKAYESINDSPDAITFSWELDTIPVPVAGHKPTATLVIDSTKVEASKLKLIEDALYGTESTAAYLPLPDELLALIA